MLQFLVSTSASTSDNTSVFEDPPYFKDLVVKFGKSDTSNDEILGWIEVSVNYWLLDYWRASISWIAIVSWTQSLQNSGTPQMWEPMG